MVRYSLQFSVRDSTYQRIRNGRSGKAGTLPNSHQPLKYGALAFVGCAGVRAPGDISYRVATPAGDLTLTTSHTKCEGRTFTRRSLSYSGNKKTKPVCSKHAVTPHTDDKAAQRESKVKVDDQGYGMIGG